MLKGIGHMAFVVEDFDKALRFYQTLCGFTPIHTMERDGKPWLTYLKCKDGQFIELFHGGTVKREKTVRNPAGFAHMCLEVDDIQEIRDKIVSLGYPLDVDIQTGKDHNKQCWTKDPDGNPIEFMQLDERSPQAQAK